MKKLNIKNQGSLSAMKAMVKKECLLVIYPAIVLLLFCAALLIVPSYPYSVAVSYCTIGIMSIFFNVKANKDMEFSSVLPVPRSSIVLGKHFVVALCEIAQVIIAIPFALLSTFVFNKTGNIVGIDANFAFFGFVLIGYTIFNLVMLPWFFKSAYKVGWPVSIGLISFFLFMAFVEIMTNVVPGFAKLFDGVVNISWAGQISALVVGIIVYIGGLILSYKLSVKSFEKVNL